MNTVIDTLADPLITPENSRFWKATESGLLVIKRCAECLRSHWHPRNLCPWCLSDNTEWQQVSGEGYIYSYTDLNNGSYQFPTYIRLAEGPIMLSLVICDPASTIDIGAPVSVYFAKTTGGFNVPVFRPA
jgi:uncharacterized OB-fold protein